MNAARAKVEAEGACRACGIGGAHRLDAAHIIARGATRAARGYADPLNIVPLCSRAKGGTGCHDEYDARQLDLLPVLRVEEQARAVELAGGIEAARRRLAPRAYATTRVAPRGESPDDELALDLPW